MPTKEKALSPLKTKTRLQPFLFIRMLPNLATVVAMCMGLTAIRLGFIHQFELATGAILVAAVLDALDGRLARLLGAASEFGAELDSFSDFISFGVAPALVMHFFSMHVWHAVGWSMCLFYAVCMAFRLARFNISSRNTKQPSWSHRFFVGVPAPAGALICLLPLIFYHALGESWPGNPWVSFPFILLAAGLMVSRFPTFSLKTLSIPRVMVFPLLILMGLMVTFIFSAPWQVLCGIILLYLMSIPIAFYSFKRLCHSTEKPGKAS